MFWDKPREEQNKSKDKKCKILSLVVCPFLPLEAALGFFVACYTGGILSSAENKNLT